jgi:hypothetical protein
MMCQMFGLCYCVNIVQVHHNVGYFPLRDPFPEPFTSMLLFYTFCIWCPQFPGNIQISYFYTILIEDLCLDTKNKPLHSVPGTKYLEGRSSKMAHMFLKAK